MSHTLVCLLGQGFVFPSVSLDDAAPSSSCVFHLLFLSSFSLSLTCISSCFCTFSCLFYRHCTFLSSSDISVLFSNFSLFFLHIFKTSFCALFSSFYVSSVSIKNSSLLFKHNTHFLQQRLFCFQLGQQITLISLIFFMELSESSIRVTFSTLFSVEASSFTGVLSLLDQLINGEPLLHHSWTHCSCSQSCKCKTLCCQLSFQIPLTDSAL